MSPAVETKDAECQTVLQCSPHLLPAGHKANVLSDADCQTLVTVNPSELDAQIVAQLTYTDPNDIDRDALREIDSSVRKEYTPKLTWQLPEESKDKNLSATTHSVSSRQAEAPIQEELLEADPTEQKAVPEEQATVPEEQDPVPEEQELVPDEQKPVSEQQEPNKGLDKNTDSIQSMSEDLKGILREPDKPKQVSQICQTNLMVFPHVLSKTDNVMVTSELAAQTSVTCLPEGSISDIIPKLKAYLVHDGKAVGTSGDSEENTSVLDLIQELIREVEITHSHMFDPDYIPPTLPPDLTSNLELSDNDYFLHILDSILTSATEPLEEHRDSDITSMDFEDTVDAMVNSTMDKAEADLKPGTGAGCSCSTFGFKIKLLINNNNSVMCAANVQQATCFEFIITQATEPGKQNGSCTQLTASGKEITMPLKVGEMKIECCDARPIQIIVKSDLDPVSDGTNSDMDDSPGAIVRELLYEMAEGAVKIMPGLEDECEYCAGLKQTRKSRVSFSEPLEKGSRCLCSDCNVLDVLDKKGIESNSPKICDSEREQLNDEEQFKAMVEKENSHNGESEAKVASTSASSLSKAEDAPVKNDESPVDDKVGPVQVSEKNIEKTQSLPTASSFNSTRSSAIIPAIRASIPDKISLPTASSFNSTRSSAIIPAIRASIPDKISLPTASSFNSTRSSAIIPAIRASIPDKISSSDPCLGLSNKSAVSNKELSYTPLNKSISSKFSCTRCARLSLPEVFEPKTCAMACQADSSSSIKIKVDPVALALQACDEGFKPIKKAINEVHQKLMMLNIPELEYLYKKKPTDTAFTRKRVYTSKLYLHAKSNIFSQRSQGTMSKCGPLRTTKTQTNYDKSFALSPRRKKSSAASSSCSRCSRCCSRTSSSSRQCATETNSSSSASSKSSRRHHKKKSKHSKRKTPSSGSERSSMFSPSSTGSECSYACNPKNSKESNRKKRRGKRKCDLDQVSSASIILSLRPATSNAGPTVKIDKCIVHGSKKGHHTPHTKKLQFTNK